MEETKVVIVLYSDPQRKVMLEQLGSDLPLRFHRVSTHTSVGEQLRAIEAIASAPQQKIGGVIGINDFAGALASAVGSRLDLTVPSLEACYQAQHKACFVRHATACSPTYPPTRLLQSKSDIPEEASWYPGFVKPAASALSAYAFVVRDPTALRERFREIQQIRRADVDWREALYGPLMAPGDPPLSALLLQPFLDLPQYTVDGYVFQGQLHLVGMTASIFDPPGHSFERFDFPARLGEKTGVELRQVVARLVASLGFNNGCFNVEFFVTGEGSVVVIEFNIRLAVQFVPLFTARYASNYLVEACRLALGKIPRLIPLDSPQMASSCVLRCYEDRAVLEVPDEAVIARLIRKGILHSARLLAEPGKRLSDYKQDAYSFRYALFNILYRDGKERDDKIRQAKEYLHFEFK